MKPELDGVFPALVQQRSAAFDDAIAWLHARVKDPTCRRAGFTIGGMEFEWTRGQCIGEWVDDARRRFLANMLDDRQQ